MSSFAIRYGPTPLCSFDLGTRSVTLHPGREHESGILVLDESEKINFLLTPQSPGTDYRIFIGDVPISDILASPEDASGSDMGSQRVWRGLPYFESARGHTTVVLESQPENSPDGRWQPVLTLNVYVLASKLGEARYEHMTRDLQDVSRSLLVDLYGK